MKTSFLFSIILLVVPMFAFSQQQDAYEGVKIVYRSVEYRLGIKAQLLALKEKGISIERKKIKNHFCEFSADTITYHKSKKEKFVLDLYKRQKEIMKMSTGGIVTGDYQGKTPSCITYFATYKIQKFRTNRNEKKNMILRGDNWFIIPEGRYTFFIVSKDLKKILYSHPESQKYELKDISKINDVRILKNGTVLIVLSNPKSEKSSCIENWDLLNQSLLSSQCIDFPPDEVTYFEMDDGDYLLARDKEGYFNISSLDDSEKKFVKVSSAPVPLTHINDYELSLERLK